MGDITGYGTSYTNKTVLSTVEGGFRGAGISRDLSLISHDAGSTGNLTLNMNYTGTSNSITCSSTAGTTKLGGIDGIPSLEGDVVNLRCMNERTPKDTVLVASTINLVSATYDNGTAGVGATITGTVVPLVIDAVTISVGDRVLIRSQTLPRTNGIYVLTSLSTSYVLTRSTDFDTPTKARAGSYCFVRSGTSNGGNIFIQSTSGTLILGVSDILFDPFIPEPSISGCSDVQVGALTGTELLTFDIALGKWVPKKLMAGAAAGTLIVASGGDASSFLASTGTTGDILSVKTTVPAGLAYDSPLTVVGSRLVEGGGSLVLKNKTTGALIGLEPSTDSYAVVRANPTDPLRGVTYSNVFDMLSSRYNHYCCDLSYVEPGTLTPGGAGSVPHVGAAGALIPIGNFFDDAAAQLDRIGVVAGGVAIPGGVGSAGITFNPANLTAGVTYHFKLSYAVSLLASPITVPIMCMTMMVQDKGTPGEIRWTTSAQVFSFSSTTGVASITFPPFLVSVTSAAVPTFDLCLQVMDAGAHPDMWLSSYLISCHLAP